MRRREFLEGSVALWSFAALSGVELIGSAPMSSSSNQFGVKALTFDVFGTVVDWRGSIIREGKARFHHSGLTEEEKNHWNRVWHRLTPWPDAVEGLTRLKKKFIISTLSNGNISLLVEGAKFGGLPWDMVLSAELFHHYKTDREVYVGAADLLGCQPAEVMMVAAHPASRVSS
jgi:FMN phosphatase YigB (HAD superfamily)